MHMASATSQNASTFSYTGSAAARVFAVAELLEDILTYLRPAEIYGVQRVNSTFNSTIAGSKQIRSLMHCGRSYDTMKPLLNSHTLGEAISPFNIWLQPEYERLAVLCAEEGKLEAKLDRNFDLRDSDILVFVFIEREETDAIHGAETKVAACKARVKALSSTAASWRSIQVSGPGQRILVSFSHFVGHMQEVFELEGGSTLGELIDGCVDGLEKFWRKQEFDARNEDGGARA
ncbi:hypothetical protein HII31_06279 [Pseudocercospora fuligena]|uniref:F-box domain-containing protein n=1 Tax=Pseudocercospora fuligena TaxID=685502 RepID=A0A8H6RKH7_9PEZI|nr:hypothetical protein HII31_06279 [Pseudocercospora fuligena]